MSGFYPVPAMVFRSTCRSRSVSSVPLSSAYGTFRTVMARCYHIRQSIQKTVKVRPWQKLALAFTEKSLKPLEVFPLRSKAVKWH